MAVMGTQVEMYRAARERLRAARMRGDDTDSFERVVEAIWSMMDSVDRRSALGVGNGVEMKRAA